MLFLWVLQALIHTLGFDLHLSSVQASTLALVFNKHFGLHFKFLGNFKFWGSRSSTALVFACWLWLVLRASLWASAGAMSIGWLGLRMNSRWGRHCQALAAGGRLNRQQNGNIQQLPCQGRSAVHESYTVATAMLNFVGNRCCSRAFDWSSEAAFQAEAWFLVN